jgi:iron complex transport system substrate-binding protein
MQHRDPQQAGMAAACLRMVVAFAMALFFIQSAAAREVVDSAGRTVAVPATVTRVYAAGPPASIMVFAIAPEKLLGWTRAMTPEEAAFLPREYAYLPALGRLTGRANTANVEVVLAARPDLIVDAGATGETYVSLADRVQAQTGLPYLLFDGTFAATAASLRALGNAMGDGARAELLAGYVERRLDAVKTKVAAIPRERRPRVYYARGTSGLQTALSGSINVEVLDVLGAVNVAGSQSAASGLANVSMEQVLAWNPGVIVTTDPTFFTRVWTDARWSNIAAVKSARVYLSPQLPFGWFDFPPGPNRLVGLLWLANILYPDVFNDDLRVQVAEFYRTFYHREPTAAQLDALLVAPRVDAP